MLRGGDSLLSLSTPNTFDTVLSCLPYPIMDIIIPSLRIKRTERLLYRDDNCAKLLHKLQVIREEALAESPVPGEINVKLDL